METELDLLAERIAEDAFAHGAACADTQYLPGGGRDTARDAAKRAARMLQQYDDGAPEWHDLVPAWLSGEWADEPTPETIRQDYGIPEGDEGDDILEQMCSLWEEHATHGWESAMVAHLRAVVDAAETR